MNFLTLSIVSLNLIAYIMQKKLRNTEIYATALFSGVLQLLVDYVLISVYGLYGYFCKQPDIRALVISFGIYPAINTIFLNFFPFKRSNKSRGLYIFAWTIFAVLFERKCVKHGIFIYRNWKSWYSAVIYPFVFLLLVLNLGLLRRLRN